MMKEEILHKYTCIQRLRQIEKVAFNATAMMAITAIITAPLLILTKQLWLAMPFLATFASACFWTLHRRSLRRRYDREVYFVNRVWAHVWEGQQRLRNSDGREMVGYFAFPKKR